MSSAAVPSSTTPEPWLEVTASRTFTGWLAAQKVSLACTTYQTGKLLLLGRRPDGGLSVFERTFQRCMGLWAGGRDEGPVTHSRGRDEGPVTHPAQTLWMSTLYQLWRFENLLAPGVLHDGYDRLYVPMTGHTTGDLDVHDVAVDATGRLVFVATKFNCLATLAPRASFAPLWRPPFVSKLAGEDRCHLNGLALEEGQPRFVTAVSSSDVVDAWRDRRRDGGVVVDVAANAVTATGLSMPHSPRIHRGRLWLLNSGVGALGFVDGGRFVPVAFCPGYARGLVFVGDFAVVGLSKPRHESTFGGLPLDDELARRGAESRCGLLIIDSRSGDVAEWVRFGGEVAELYDVAALPEVSRPMALGFKTEEIQRLIAVAEPAARPEQGRSGA